MSYILLDVIEEMRLLQPSSMVQLSKLNPDSFIDRAVKITKTASDSLLFSIPMHYSGTAQSGKDIVDARNGGASGCVETGAFGTESYILCGYFNMPKILELTLHNGFDTRTQKQIGLKTGEAADFKPSNSF
jgi:formate C-acetyltransferase